MKTGAKRQVVMCPACGAVKVSLGEVFFRCCGDEHKITENLVTRETLKDRDIQKQGLEVVI